MVVKSNSTGAFSASFPLSEAPIGSEVRVYVNNSNNTTLIVSYDSQKFSINTNKIEVLNNESVPVFNIEFDPINNTLEAIAYPLDQTYAGAFYGQYLDIKVINPTNGDTIYDFNGNELNDINSFISEINNKSYSLGDIIEISYNPNYKHWQLYN